MGLFDGKVVIVTGAGGGIGKCHALAFAKEGAKVVVNDLGGARDGSGGSQSMADTVVEEIRQAGGTAVANYDSVSDSAAAKNIIDTAVKEFGRLDVLVNNAGILRDKTLLKMDDDMWRAVIAVHLDGTFYCGREAARYMKENGIQGRIVNTTSVSGLKGNFGQSNYSAAKAGIAGLTRTWALELSRNGITINAVAPIAKTRMTEEFDTVPEDFGPEKITPMVVFLASDLAADVNGRIFGVHGRHVFEYKMLTTEGVQRDSDWTATEIARNLDKIAALATAPAPAAAAKPDSVEERVRLVFSYASKAFVPEKAGGWKANIQFVIDGAEDHTIIVDSGKVDVKVGRHGDPTCKVEVGAGTLADMIEGKISGQQAFMSGKIKANNLQDMMTFGKAFDFKKGRAAAEAEMQGAGGGGSLTLEERIRKVFELAIEAFTPDKAAGWKANMQFIINGADDHTILVEDSKVEVKVGLHGEATCKVDISAQTLSDMIEGKVSGEQAFMTGKIKATNLKDMMQYGKVFNYKKVREKYASSTTAKAADLGTYVHNLPKVFLADKAGTWKGKVAILAGDDAWTVAVADKACTVEDGGAADAMCKITVDPGALAELFSGKTTFAQISADKKIKANNAVGLLKFRQLFDWSSPLLAETESADAKDSGLNRDLIGKKFRGAAMLAYPEKIHAYAAATDDPNPLFSEKDEGKLIAPPLFPVTMVGATARDALADCGGNLLRMVHGEQRIRYHRPIRAWDLIAPRAVVAEIEDKDTGQIMHIDQSLYCEGELAVEMRISLFFRNDSSGKKKDGGEAKQEPETPREKAFSRSVTVAEDQSYRYADASGDHNPIHKDPEIAKSAGLKGIILHGLCTMAFAGQAVVEEHLKGDAGKLRELSVRFRKPVFPGDTLTTEGYIVDDNTVEFAVVNQEGVPVITNGVAKVG